MSADGEQSMDWRATLSPSLVWREHRLHVGGAAGLMGVGAVFGVILAVAGVDLFALLGLDDPGELFEDVDFTATGIFLNNTRAFVVLLVGTITVGVLTAFVLLFNGLVIGYVVVLVAVETGPGFVFLGILPHGVLELPAIWVAGGVALRFVHCGIDRIREVREVLLTREEFARSVAIVLVAWIALGIAAVIEVHITPELLELVYPEVVNEDGDG